MISSPVFLGIDVGTSNTKLAAVSIDDGSVRELAVTSAPTPDSGDELLDRLGGLIRRTVEATSGAGRLVAVGIASMAETGVLQDEDGASLGGLLRWDAAPDPSSRADVSAIIDELDSSGLRERTGVPHTHKAPLAVWAALRRARDERWAASASWNGVADFVGHAFTGRNAMDHTLAARTMASVFDPTGSRAGGLDAEILGRWDLDPSMFPDVLVAGDPLGVVHPSAAARFGLPAGVPVVLAGHDHAVAAWGADLRTPGRSVDSIGTAEAIIGLVAADVVDTTFVRRAIGSGMGVGLAVDARNVSVTAGSASSGGLVELLLAELPSDRRAGVLADASRLAIDPGPVAQPYPRGRQSPAPDRDAVLDIPPSADGPAARVAAALRGLAHHARWMFDTVDSLAPSSHATVIAGGPAVASPSWRSLRARVFDRDLEVLDIREPVAVSAAVLAAVRTGWAPPGSRLPTSPIRIEPAPPAEIRIHEARQHTDFVRRALSRSGRPHDGTSPSETGGS